MICKATFEQEGQKIVITFNVTDKNELAASVKFEPEIIDPKQTLGLSGELAFWFLDNLKRSGQIKEETINESNISEN